MTGTPARPRVVYFVSSYQSGEQLVRLVRTLRAGRRDVPIVLHHDLGGEPLRPEVVAALGDTHIRSSPEPIGWGDMTLEQARWRVLAWIRENVPFDWVVLLSEQDYPLKPVAEIERLVAETGADAILDAAPLDELTGERRREMERRYFYRYDVAPRLLQPTSGEGRGSRWLERVRCKAEGAFNRVQRRRQIYRFAVPGRPTLWGRRAEPGIFGPGFRCWSGSAWYALSAEACRYLLDFVETRPEVVEHYSRTVIPLEGATLSIVANAPELLVRRAPLHYVRWSDSASGRPDVFAPEDLAELCASDLPFARKVDLDRHGELLDALDLRVRSPQDAG